MDGHARYLEHAWHKLNAAMDGRLGEAERQVFMFGAGAVMVTISDAREKGGPQAALAAYEGMRDEIHENMAHAKRKAEGV